MTRFLIPLTLALGFARPASAQTDPWYVTKVSIARKDLGPVTLSVDPKTMSCYVDTTWEQGQIDFDAAAPLSGTDTKHTHWSHYVEGEGFCDQLAPPYAKELADSSITLNVSTETWFIATYFKDGQCTFSATEVAKGTHPTLGDFEDRTQLFEQQLTTETCKQAFATWPQN